MSPSPQRKKKGHSQARALKKTTSNNDGSTALITYVGSAEEDNSDYMGDPKEEIKYSEALSRQSK